MPYDAIIVVSFGGPERPEDVEPFLDNVLRGKPVPAERRAAVVQHYLRFGGRSPIAPATRALTSAIARCVPDIPVYLGNRNWHPFLEDTLRTMAAGGIRRALAFVTSAFGSYSGCRQYLEDIERARAAVGPTAPIVDKLPLFHDHPCFLAIWSERVRQAMAQSVAPINAGLSRARTRDSKLETQNSSRPALLFTAHSIPVAMAQAGPYVSQLEAAARAITAAVGCFHFSLAYQSRSGPPHVPWLEPSVEASLDHLATQGAPAVIAIPLGFISDHMEVIYDLDIEAREHAQRLGLAWQRVRTPGDHPRFAAMVASLVAQAQLTPPAACALRCCL